MILQPHIESFLEMCDKTLEDFLGKEEYQFYTSCQYAKRQRKIKRKRKNQIKL